MKQPAASVLLIALLLALLGALAWLQYVWLGQISDATRERLRSRLQSNAKYFADDFNREMRGAYLFYQFNQALPAANARYKLWQSQTKYPQLIEGYYLIRKDAAPLRYDVAAQNFQAAEWTPELREIERRAASEKQTFAEPTIVNSLTILLPAYAARKTENADSASLIAPDSAGWAAIKFDEAVVRQMLADLKARYFPDEEERYHLAVTERIGSKIIYANSEITPRTADASVALFDLSANSMMVIGSPQNSAASNVSILRSPAANFPPNAAESAAAQMEKTPTKGLWLLTIQHADGSLENFVSKTRHRNLAVSLGILLLLAASVGLIFVSAQRARTFAERQVDFVSSVSHEFRTPLAVIGAASENLTDGIVTSPEKIARYGDLIKTESAKLARMVEGILEYAGARSGADGYVYTETLIAPLVEDALAECRALLEKEKFTVETQIAVNLPTIRADGHALSRALQNLIVNAVKYDDGNKHLKIAAENAGDSLKITVEDRGIGIAKKDLGRIFAAFYRAEAVATRQIRGSGLGLSLVKQIVEAHGGKVAAESAIGKGSRFTIYLPFSVYQRYQKTGGENAKR